MVIILQPALGVSYYRVTSKDKADHVDSLHYNIVTCPTLARGQIVIVYTSISRVHIKKKKVLEVNAFQWNLVLALWLTEEIVMLSGSWNKPVICKKELTINI